MVYMVDRDYLVGLLGLCNLGGAFLCIMIVEVFMIFMGGPPGFGASEPPGFRG